MKSKPKEINLKKELDALHEKHGPIVFRFDGGNDSGCYYVEFEKSGKEVEDPIYSEVIDKIDGHLGYGSFAGDFYVEGSLTYSPEESAFIGSSTETTSESTTLRTKGLTVSFPKDLWFSEYTFDIQKDSDGGSVFCTGNLIVKNGPISEEHNSLPEIQQDKVEKFIENAINESELEVESIYETISIPRSSFKEDGKGNIFFEIKSIEVSVPQREEHFYHVEIE